MESGRGASVNELGGLVWTQLVHRRAAAESNGSAWNLVSTVGSGIGTSIGRDDPTNVAVTHLARAIAGHSRPVLRTAPLTPDRGGVAHTVAA